MRILLAIAAVLASASPAFAQAYFGPGGGISAIGTLLAILAALIFGVIGFIWYPVKQLLRALRKRSGPEEIGDET